MKKIIYRVKATGKISHDSDYDECFRRYTRLSEKELLEMIAEFNEKRENLFAKIVELDDVAEFYAKRVEQPFNIPDYIAEQLRDIANSIDCIRAKLKTTRGNKNESDFNEHTAEVVRVDF